mmetsp:Transcript_3913/g.12677  ORF Transcript_3913/g.12677 Transcript_3913/m.12677 type:complete len:251 (-) Transcript_3913:48-800(-)
MKFMLCMYLRPCIISRATYATSSSLNFCFLDASAMVPPSMNSSTSHSSSSPALVTTGNARWYLTRLSCCSSVRAPISTVFTNFCVGLLFRLFFTATHGLPFCDLSFALNTWPKPPLPAGAFSNLNTFKGFSTVCLAISALPAEVSVDRPSSVSLPAGAAASSPSLATTRILCVIFRTAHSALKWASPSSGEKPASAKESRADSGSPATLVATTVGSSFFATGSLSTLSSGAAAAAAAAGAADFDFFPPIL